MNNCLDIILYRIDVKFDIILSLFYKRSYVYGMQAEVLAPESTRALMVGIPNSGKEHHSSLPRIILFCNILKGV